MARRGLRRNKRGQFLILISLGIVIVMVALSSVLSYTAVSPIQFSKTKFRETATQLSINFRQALAMALADVSKELDRKASVSQYLNYTKLDEYPQAKDKGYESLTEWQKITLLRQSGLGLNLTISKPDFQCDWGSSQGCSKAEANMTLDILSYGFYGWKNKVIVELNLTILSLTSIDENTTTFGFNLKREQGIPVSGVIPSLIKIFFQTGEYKFDTNPASIKGLAYFGEGNYLLTCDTRNATYPIIKMILQDPSGIVVGAYSALTIGDDTTGPKVTKISASKIHVPHGGTKVINITATISDFGAGFNPIAAAEYFIGTPGADGTGESMILDPGELDHGEWNQTIQVKVWAQINVTGWALGNYIVFVHGKDSEGNWGDFANTTLKVSNLMHIKSMTIYHRHEGYYLYVYVNVTIVDESGAPVNGAVVTGYWTGQIRTPPPPETSKTTGANGVATLRARMRYHGKFSFTVTDVTKAGYWEYDPSANEVPGPPYSITGTFY